jgi:hypothetical protein
MSRTTRERVSRRRDDALLRDHMKDGDAGRLWSSTTASPGSPSFNPAVDQDQSSVTSTVIHIHVYRRCSPATCGLVMGLSLPLNADRSVIAASFAHVLQCRIAIETRGLTLHCSVILLTSVLQTKLITLYCFDWTVCEGRCRRTRSKSPQSRRLLSGVDGISAVYHT